MSIMDGAYLLALSDQVGAALRDSGGGITLEEVCRRIGCTPYSQRGLAVVVVLTRMSDGGRVTRESVKGQLIWGAGVPSGKRAD